MNRPESTDFYKVSARFAAASFLTLSILLLPACNVSSTLGKIVKNVQVKTSSDDQGNAWAQLSIQLNSGNIGLPAFEFPIVDPKDPLQVYGTLGMKQGKKGPIVTINADLTSVMHANSLERTLPNGAALPVAGINENEIIGLPVGKSNARVYFAISETNALIGTAIPISQFDRLGGILGGLNFFPQFKLGNGITGIAGIFSGTAPKTSGLAIFVDASAALHPQTAGATKLARKPKLRFIESAVPADLQAEVEAELREMQRNRERLTIH